MTQKLCSCGKKILASNLCSSCYQKERRKNPEYKEHDKKRAKKWRKNNPEMFKEQVRKYREKNPEKVKKWRQNYSKKHKKELNEQTKKYLKTHPDKAKKWARISYTRKMKKETCSILQKHAEDLKDDPEHLSTAFLQKIIGIKCKKNNKSQALSLA